MNTEKKFCFSHESGNDIFLFTLSNNLGTEVQISNYGALITSFMFLDKKGDPNDIVLGFENIQDYLSESYLSNYPFIGAACGRYANRIKDARFKIDNIEYKLTPNSGNDILHGGNNGFDKKIWEPITTDQESSSGLTLKYIRKEH